jgi:glutamate carboxypeptidase
MQFNDLPNWINKQKADIEAALEQLVNINTLTANTAGVDQGMAVLEGMATGMGFDVDPINQRHRLIRSGNGTGKRLMLITHMDTVHAPDSPFKTYQNLGDGFVTGPGVGDIKGGTVIGLWAMKAVEALMPDENYDLVMIVSADEEKGSPTIRDWYGDREQHGADYAIGLEPGFPQGDLSATVDLGVVYQRRGYSAITFNVVGKASHSGTPWLGLSAIDALAHKITKLTALNDWDNGISVNVGLVKGGTAPNTVAGEAEATVSFRYETLADGIAMREKIEEIILEPTTRNDEQGVSDSAVYHVDTFIPPMERTDDSQKLVDIVLEEAKTLEQPVVAIARGGGSDANHVSGSGTPSICGMGAPAHGIHTNDEKIYLPMLFERVGLLARTCYRVLNEQP